MGSVPVCEECIADVQSNRSGSKIKFALIRRWEADKQGSKKNNTFYMKVLFNLYISYRPPGTSCNLFQETTTILIWEFSV